MTFLYFACFTTHGNVKTVSQYTLKKFGGQVQKSMLTDKLHLNKYLELYRFMLAMNVKTRFEDTI